MTKRRGRCDEEGGREKAKKMDGVTMATVIQMVMVAMATETQMV